MPYLYLENSFFGALVRRPDRFNVLLGIPFGLLASYGLIEITYLPHLFARKETLWVILCGFIVFESLTNYPTYELTTPAWYGELAQDETSFAILDLPRHQRVYDEQYMYYQFVHGKPLVGGHVSRPPAETFAFINTVPFLRDSGLALEPLVDMYDIGRQLNLLAAQDVRYLILHKQFLSVEQQAAWRDWLVVEPLHDDDELIVYSTAAVPPITQALTAEIGIVQSSVTPTSTAQAGWLDIELVWGSQAEPTGDYDVCFVLQDEAGVAVQTDCQPITADYPTSNWLAQDFVRGRYSLNVDPYLAASGSYTLLASLSDSAGEAVSLTTVNLRAEYREFSAPTPQTVTEIDWDVPIRLVGYDLEGSSLTLHWQALERVPATYAIFRHLIDPESGELVGQVDGAPRYWGYPTNWWEAGEYVSETVILPLDQLQRKEYLLFLGMYDPETNERVDVFKGNGELWANSAVFLTTTPLD